MVYHVFAIANKKSIGGGDWVGLNAAKPVHPALVTTHPTAKPQKSPTIEGRCGWIQCGKASLSILARKILRLALTKTQSNKPFSFINSG